MRKIYLKKWQKKNHLIESAFRKSKNTPGFKERFLMKVKLWMSLNKGVDLSRKRFLRKLLLRLNLEPNAPKQMNQVPQVRMEAMVRKLMKVMKIQLIILK